MAVGIATDRAFRRTTSAPGTTACCGSLTTPEMEPLCADAAAGRAPSSSNVREARRTILEPDMAHNHAVARPPCPIDCADTPIEDADNGRSCAAPLSLVAPRTAAP